jgi:energy-coupling factor transporter ATP-binding protein EcfA2
VSTDRINEALDGAEPMEPSRARIELTECSMKPKDALLAISDEAEPWRTPEDTVYATVRIDGHNEHHAVESRKYREWLLSELVRRYTNKGYPASANEAAVREARHHAEAQAFLNGRVQRAELRIMGDEQTIFIDRGTPDWSAIQVTTEGWSVIATPPVPILRSRRTAPMVEPAAPGDFGPLRRILGNLDDDGFILVVAWLLGALAARGPFTVLVLIGEGGVGKSTLVRIIQGLVDPCTGDVLAPPREDRDLIAAAKHGRVLAFDNLSSVSPELGDSICRLATGAEIGGRALYTNHDTASFSASRPIMLNGIADLAARSDLLDRALVVRLQSLESRTTESELRAATVQVLPHVFHALLDALATGLRQLKSTPVPDVRMADFARLVVAAEAALPWQPGAFLAALKRSRQHALAALVEGDVVGKAMMAFAHRHPKGWHGLVSQLYEQLPVSTDVRRSAEWPRNPRWLSEKITRVAPALRSLGLPVDLRRTAAGSEVTIGPSATQATSASSEPDVHDANVASGAGLRANEMPSRWNGSGQP